jgi:hypothetical protein
MSAAMEPAMSTASDLGPLPLRPEHLDHLRGSGLSDETLRRAGLCSLDERAAYALGYPAGLRGIGFPYPGTQVQIDGRRVPYTRLRVDPDRQREPGRKYENPLRSRLQEGLTYYPYVPPGVDELRKRADQPILITEGEKKALKLAQEGWPAIGLPGVFLFTDPTSKKTPPKKPLHPELRRWRLRGRQVLVSFDSDRSSKEGVALAHERLCAGLTRMGALVRVIDVPSLPGQEKTGADDFLVASGCAAFAELVDAARAWEAFAFLVELVPPETATGALSVALEPARAWLRSASREELVGAVSRLRERFPQLDVLAATELLTLSETDARGDDEPPPEIVVNHRQVRDVVDDAWDALLGSRHGRSVLRYGDGLVFVPRQCAPAGDPVSIQPLDQPLLTALLNRAATWLHVVEEGKTRDARQPPDVTRDMLALPHRRVPVMSGLTRLPPMRRDGSVAAEAGLDPHSGLLHVADPAVIAAVARLPETPDAADVAAALQLLTFDLFGDFPFARPSDRAHALAALLHPFVRHLVRGPTPLHLVEAPSEGTGKGLLAKVIHLVAVGSVAPPTPLPTSEEEVRKKITAALMTAPSVLLLDNIGHVLDSASLAAALTTSVWTDRLLGQTKMVTTPNRALWLATGNNPVLSRENARRTVRIRLDADVEQPWLRDGFRHADLPGWVRAQRPALVVAVLTLLRSWAQAGRQRCAVRLGSFEDWASVVGGVLGHVGVEGFLADRQDDHEVCDPEEEEWAAFVQTWSEAFGEERVPARELLRLAGEVGAFHLDSRAMQDSRAKGSFSVALSKRRDRRYGPWRITVRRDTNRKVNLYALVR